MQGGLKVPKKASGPAARMGLGTLAGLGARRWEMLNSIHTNLAADCHLIVAVCIRNSQEHIQHGGVSFPGLFDLIWASVY